jgi:hypothetical protein
VGGAASGGAAGEPLAGAADVRAARAENGPGGEGAAGEAIEDAGEHPLPRPRRAKVGRSKGMEGDDFGEREFGRRIWSALGAYRVFGAQRALPCDVRPKDGDRCSKAGSAQKHKNAGTLCWFPECAVLT